MALKEMHSRSRGLERECRLTIMIIKNKTKSSALNTRNNNGLKLSSKSNQLKIKHFSLKYLGICCTLYLLLHNIRNKYSQIIVVILLPKIKRDHI